MIRKIWKTAILVLVLILNFFPSLVRANDVIYSNQVAVLVYHHIDDQNQGGVTISSRLFADQLNALNRKGFHFITLDQFKQFISKGADIPDNAVLVTFDDGYESFYTKAFPILKKLNVPAVNFVITKDLEDPLHSLIPSLSREEIRQMRKEDPNIDFQGHSDSLHIVNDGKPMLTNKIMINGLLETDDQFKLRVLNDTKTCMAKLKELDESQVENAYAYPFGSYDNQTVELLTQAGVQYGFTTNAGIVSRQTDPMQIPRINAGSPYIRVHSINNLIKQALRHQLRPML